MDDDPTVKKKKKKKNHDFSNEGHISGGYI